MLINLQTLLITLKSEICCNLFLTYLLTSFFTRISLYHNTRIVSSFKVQRVSAKIQKSLGKGSLLFYIKIFRCGREKKSLTKPLPRNTSFMLETILKRLDKCTEALVCVAWNLRFSTKVINYCIRKKKEDYC